MLEGIDAYPLSWPAAWYRTKPHLRSYPKFADRSVAHARDFVLDELRLLGASQPIISTNIILRQDGLPRSGQKAPVDPGVAVYFVLKGQPKVLACDRWVRVEDNLWAIGKHIEAIRGQERWGVGTIDQAFMGYSALPAPVVNWWEVLGVDRAADPETIQAAFRQKARITHPDAGGNSEDFIRVQAAWEAVRKERGVEHNA
jgi:hypothetical protein